MRFLSLLYIYIRHKTQILSIMTLRHINTISLSPVAQEWGMDKGFYRNKCQGKM